MNPFERALRTVDEAQQRVRPLAFAFGVIKKFGDDRGGSLCALLAFYGFLSLFPLLLLLVTVLGFFGGGEHSLVHRVESSAFSQFPIVGTKLSTNIHGLHDRSMLGLVVGIVGVLWGSQGALQTAQYAQAEVWNIPGVNRPSFWARLGRTAGMTVTLGLFLLVSTVLAGLVTIGHHGGWAVAGAALTSLVVNVALYLVAFRLLTPQQIRWGDMVPGAIAGGSRMDRAPVPRRRSGGALVAEHEQGVRHVRAGAGPDRIPLPGRRGDGLRGRAQRGPSSASLAEEHGAASAHDRRQEGAVLDHARGETATGAVCRNRLPRRQRGGTT